MSRSQRFVIVRKRIDNIDVIGTSSGQLFGESAAHRHVSKLNEKDGSFHVMEIAKLMDYLMAGD